MGSLNPLATHRGAGVLVPLASLRSSQDAGTGDLRDLRLFIDWCAAQGLSLIQLLPVSPVSPLAPFPYSAYSAFGLDLSIITLDEIPEAREALNAARSEIDVLHQAPRLAYEKIYALKHRILQDAWQKARPDPQTRQAMQQFRESESLWLNDFVRFTAYKEQFGWRSTASEWNGAAPDEERMLFHTYVQWIAHRQWAETLSYAHTRNVYLMGDMPIYVGGDSVDVWAKRQEFDLDADGGAPPDYFNWLGQNWNAPLYNWDHMKADGFQWWQRRVRYNARLFDWMRFDHFRGVSEYWRIPRRPAILDEIEREREIPRVAKEYEKVSWFWPIRFRFQFREKMPFHDWEKMTDAERFAVIQHINAEWKSGPADAFVQMMLDASTRERGTGWVVEDLGADMDAVFALRDRFDLAGMRVTQFFGFDDQGRPNLHADPRSWPENCLGMTDTHDLPPLRAWVQSLSWDERGRIASVYGMTPPDGQISPEALETQMMRTLFHSPARWVMTSLQTLLGLGAEHRINHPGVVGPQNWSWRLPIPVNELPNQPVLMEWIRESGRRLP